MLVNPNPLPPPPPPAAATPPLNAGCMESSSDLIGDATSWPSPSESTRSSPNSSSTDPPIAASQAPVNSNSTQNSVLPNTITNSNPSFSPNLNHQRLSGRSRYGRGGVSRGGFIRHPLPPQQMPSPPPLPPVLYGGFEGPIRGPFFYGNGFGTQPRSTNRQFPHPSSTQRSGGRSRGDGAHHYNHANHRGSDWNTAPQGFHPRDVRLPQPNPRMSYPAPPQPMVPFFMHGHMLPPEPFLGMPPYTGGLVPVPPPSVSPPLPVNLQTKLLNQINYYFSDENLVKDVYLRSKMDAGGWVPVSLIAGFKRVRDLTQDIHLILVSLAASAVVELQGDKMRRRNDWRRWILTRSVTSVTEATTTELSSVMRCFQNATLEEVQADRGSSSSANNASRSPREVLT